MGALRPGLTTVPGRGSEIVAETEKEYFTVLGEVATPNKYEMTTPTTLSVAIAIAGGITDFGRKKGIRLIREKPGSGQREEIIVSLSKIEKGGSEDILLKNGDKIHVPRRRW